MKLSTLSRIVLVLVLPFLTGCASVLTTWHKKAYKPVIELDHPLLERSAPATSVEQVGDLAQAANQLYSEGFVLVGYTKFTHTLIPSFQSKYAKMYAKQLGAARAVQAAPKANGGVYAYTVTYWSKGREFPFGAYYNDLPDETALLLPDSLREQLDRGDRPVLVEAVVYDTPAEAAGLADGELIVAVNGESFSGTSELDALVSKNAESEVTLTVWGLDGLRETQCTLGDTVATADGIGPEALYYNQPWEFHDYANFQKYSQAFTNAWHASWKNAREPTLRWRT